MKRERTCSGAMLPMLRAAVVVGVGSFASEGRRCVDAARGEGTAERANEGVRARGPEAQLLRDGRAGIVVCVEVGCLGVYLAPMLRVALFWCR